MIFPRSHRGNGSVTTSSVSPALPHDVATKTHKPRVIGKVCGEEIIPRQGWRLQGSSRACVSGFKMIPAMKD